MMLPRRSVLRLVLAALAAIAPCRAQADPGTPLAARAVYVVDSADDRVLRFIDRDGSGAVEPDSAGEVVVFYDDSSPGPDLSVASALAVSPAGDLYLLDGGTLDMVLVLTDLDGDGAANGEGEWKAFYDDTSPGPNLGTPNSLAFAPDGALHVADDGSGAQRILRLVDLDGDGTANGAGEWLVVYDKTALSPAGELLLDIESIAFLPDGRLLAADSTLEKVYLLTDRNGDQDFLDAGEAAVFYDPLGAHPLTRLSGLAAGPGGEVIVMSADTGLVMRLEDQDGDGDAMDPGEAGVYLDPTLPPALRALGDLTMEADGTVLVLDTSRDAVFVLRDLDRDGAAQGEGEAQSWIADGGASLSTPSGVAVGPAPREPEVKITGLLPSSGPAIGGTTVHLSGRFPLPETAQVTFDGAPALILAAAFQAIDCRTPPGQEGPADIRVSTAAGEAVLAGAYRYLKEGSFLRGDANSDRLIDISDAVGILTHLFLGGPLPACQDTFDVDDDGALTITDPIYLLSFLFQGGEPIPPPATEPGPDGTPDNLPCTPGN